MWDIISLFFTNITQFKVVFNVNSSYKWLEIKIP